MDTISDFPFEVKEHLYVQIPMPDGIRLSARIWRPVDSKPVPAILEYLPYRKTDGTAERDALTHPYLAGHGYACVRVDMRGCGDSEGLFEDEYSPQELEDGVAVIEWLSTQPWCSGNVGMMGISWGGFNGLQIAALKPPALKAVVSLCSTVDRYADDIHYKGGLMLGENPAWAATILGWFALPPDPEIVGDGWRDLWLERLEKTPFLAETWVAEQLRSDYWKHGSVCEDYSAIEAAILSVGGWHDGYRNTVSHIVENVTAPAKGLVGPWNHKYPHFAVPGPQIDFLGEMLAWWDKWLKEIDNGVEDLPDMRRYLLSSLPPEVSYEYRPGIWIADGRSDLSGSSEVWHLVGDLMQPDDGATNRTVFPALHCGQMAGEYFPFGFGPGELPDDQRSDDALSCCFESATMDVSRDIVGAPTVRLRVSSDASRAQLAVRLCDVHPNGESSLIAHGFLNLRHRNGHDALEDVPVGEVVDVEVVLDQCAYRLPKGHKLRVALSSSYWPFVWPETETANLTIERGALGLPVRPTAEKDEWSFGGPKAATPRATQREKPGAESKRFIRNVATKQHVIEIEGDDGATLDLHTGLTSSIRHWERFSICEDDPLSAVSEFRWERDMSRVDWKVTVKADLTMRTDASSYFLTGHLSVLEDGQEIFAKIWDVAVPRL